MKDLRLAKRLAASSISRKLGKIGIKNGPRSYGAGVKRAKNKRLKKILQSDLANRALDMRRAYTFDKLG